MRKLLRDKNKIECPLCNSDDTKLMYKTDLSEIVSKIDNRDIQIREEIKKIWGGDSCKFMECNNCSFSFAFPFKGGTNKLYSLIYTNNYPKERWEYDLALNNISLEDICLEIGAGAGIFLKKLLSKCKKENIYSVEVSYNKSNYKNISDIPNNKKFSVVCMFQVLEHLDNFKEVIDKINIITTKNAKLIISVPHEDTVEFFREKIGMSDNPPIHVSRWNKNTIGKLKGWKLVDYKTNKLSYVQIFKNLFYGTRTIKYPRTRNPLFLISCFLHAITKMELKKMKDGQYFCLEKDGE